jgi:hypothetical protein
MDSLFERLRQLAAAGVLPHEQHQAVRAVVRQRAAGWPDTPALGEGNAPLVLLQKGGGSGGQQGVGEDWRSVLDARASGGGGKVQDSARAAAGGAPHAHGELPAGEHSADGEQPPSQGSGEAEKEAAVRRVLAAAPGGAAWDVATLVLQVRQQRALDLGAAADAERLLRALLDHAAASALAAGGGGPVLAEMPAAVASAADLAAELGSQWPAAAAAAPAVLGAALKRRDEARSPAARQHLALLMLLAGLLARRGALPEQQLHTMLEQLARQVGEGEGCPSGGSLAFASACLCAPVCPRFSSFCSGLYATPACQLS